MKQAFYYCPHCGNIIFHLYTSGVNVVCCGVKMLKLVPNTADAAVEKHVPAVARDGGKLAVTVGSVPHPMTEAHHISWIAAAEEDKTQSARLSPTGQPAADFCVGGSPVTVYAYCNLHGLWEAEG